MPGSISHEPNANLFWKLSYSDSDTIVISQNTEKRNFVGNKENF